jgi:excisionase family DNA binding protein
MPFAKPSRTGRVQLATQPLLTVRQVAADLGVCTATVYALVSRGELAHVRVSNAIRIHPLAVEAMKSKGTPK